MTQNSEHYPLYRYDEATRRLCNLQRKNGVFPFAYSIEGARFKTEVTDALGRKKRSLRDVRELITQVTEEGNLEFRARVKTLESMQRGRLAFHETHGSCDHLWGQPPVEDQCY